MPYRPATVIGEYRVERLLSNQGATAQVYLAHNGTHQAALKITRVNKQGYIFQDHLRQEVETLQHLDHAGVVHLYPVLQDNVYAARAETLTGQPWYFAMEYVVGQSLATHLRRITKTFSLAWRLELFRQLVESVVYLHEQGYAHCDLKPDHILLRHAPTTEQISQPVLIDFGSACPTGEAMSMLTASVPYTAPELLNALNQPAKQPVLHPAPLDIWALGAILYELVAGQRLISGYSRRAMIKNVLNGRFDLGKAPSQIRPVLARMLHFEPEVRVSIHDLQAEIQKFG
jgi:eukaryotic-like serine/threonine-protein kinase